MGIKRKPKPSSLARVRRARAVASDAVADAKRIQGNHAVNRSTRARTAYKLKADALDEVLEILSGNQQ